MKFISTQGYKRNSPDVNRPLNVIPSGRITMQDVDFPVRGVDNLGNEMFMVPGGEYFFPGDYVVETPMMQRGGQTNNDREMVEGIADILTMVKDPVNRRQIAAEMVRDFKREGVKYDLQEFQKMAQVRMQGGGQLTMEDLRQRALAQSAPRIDNTRIVSQKRIVKQEAENPLDIFPFVKNVGIDTGIDQIPYASVMMGAKALNQGRPWTALSEFAKVPLGWIGDAGINALQENPTKYSINALEDSVIPFARLVKGANFGTGESIVTRVGKQIMSSGEKPDSKWYARSFNLPGLYEAAKTYGVDNNTFTKFVEDNWENAGGDYKQILELAKTNLLKKQKGGRLKFQQYYTPAAESTGTNYTPTMTVQAAERLKTQRDAQELTRRRQAIQASQAAASKPLRERLTPENLAQETGATGDKLRFFPNDPDSFIDDYLNPLKMVGDMASGLGRIPLNVKQGNYGAAALDVAIPVATGALAGLGAKSAGQFVNNLANPLAGVGNIASNAATKSTTLGQIKSGLQDLGYIYDQSLGYLFNNRANKKAIAEGNEWLKNWIQHPTTQAKIDKDFADKINSGFVKDMYDVGYEQAKNFTPVSTELPLSVQLAKGFYPNKDNWGVSYLHHVDPMRRRMIEQGQMDAPVWHGSFISRSLDMPYKKRVGTTIHEGTHDWTSSFGLEASGQREFLERNINPEIHQDLQYWRWHGDDKTRTDLGKKRKYQAYLADPTEQHARIMELRKYLGHTPDFVSTPEYAQKVMNHLSAMPRHKRPIDSEGFFKVFDNDPQKLSNMFNRLWGVTPVVVAGAAAASKKQDAQPTMQEYKLGGYISKQVGGEPDPEMMFRDKYNTLLKPEEERKFNRWAAKESKRQGRDILMDMGSYDVRGFWKSGDYKRMDQDNHGSDTWKKPNHPTFSNHSRYHGADGWYGGNWTDEGGYQPSKQTLQMYGPDYYQWMFGTEPNRPEHLDMSRYKSGINAPTPLYYKKGGQHGGLDRWFAEKWVDIKTGKECGRQEGEKRAGYPACRPSKRISEDTPKTASELSSSEKEKFKRSKTSSERISYQHKRKQDGGEWLDKYENTKKNRQKIDQLFGPPAAGNVDYVPAVESVVGGFSAGLAKSALAPVVKSSLRSLQKYMEMQENPFVKIDLPVFNEAKNWLNKYDDQVTTK